jgi:CheY-like chemotaxis protein
VGGENKLIILVAEDDPNDVLLLQRAFQKSGIPLPVHVCHDGAETIAYLRGEGRYADRNTFPFPRVLITDLKMPRCGGFEVLEWLYVHPECNLIPKIVLSASAEERDVKRAFGLGVNCYFRKPSTFQELQEIVKLASEFWSRAVLPPLPATC